MMRYCYVCGRYARASGKHKELGYGGFVWRFGVLYRCILGGCAK